MKFKFLNISKANERLNELQAEIRKFNPAYSISCEPGAKRWNGGFQFFNIGRANAAIDNAEKRLAEFRGEKTVVQLTVPPGHPMTPSPKPESATTQPANTMTNNNTNWNHVSDPALRGLLERACPQGPKQASLAAATVAPWSDVADTEIRTLLLKEFPGGRAQLNAKLRKQGIEQSFSTPMPAPAPVATAPAAPKSTGPAQEDLKALAIHLLGGESKFEESAIGARSEDFAARKAIYFAGVSIDGMRTDDVIEWYGERPKPHGYQRMMRAHINEKAHKFLAARTASKNS